MSKKKKILLLADDIRMHSGIARMSREFVLGNATKYDWVQIGGAISHPENGKRIFLEGPEIPKESSIIIYPTNGYGNPDMLREIIQREKPDAVMLVL